ncbi:unnamed protein product [Rangifer tarandus platyrhynchus]|uniref:Uncharacterized protein n=1 Tax=Rangifer tarandus platyrhynchus TaxID=3082113 RepID=A0ABN8Y442_RANTA|nr:unnamed protein product [Rangifer tarandus platyrhynchus]
MGQQGLCSLMLRAPSEQSLPTLRICPPLLSDRVFSPQSTSASNWAPPGSASPRPGPPRPTCCVSRLISSAVALALPLSAAQRKGPALGLSSPLEDLPSVSGGVWRR